MGASGYLIARVVRSWAESGLWTHCKKSQYPFSVFRIKTRLVKLKIGFSKESQRRPADGFQSRRTDRNTFRVV